MVDFFLNNITKSTTSSHLLSGLVLDIQFYNLSPEEALLLRMHLSVRLCFREVSKRRHSKAIYA